MIRAARHVHMHVRDAEHYGVQDGDVMKLSVTSPACSSIFQDLLVRADERSRLEVHLDTDEDNACYLDGAASVELAKQEIPKPPKPPKAKTAEELTKAT